MTAESYVDRIKVDLILLQDELESINDRLAKLFSSVKELDAALTACSKEIADEIPTGHL